MLIAALPLSGCAVHNYDEKTGVTTVVGLGLFRFRPAGLDTNSHFQVTENSIVGVGLNANPRNLGISLGLDRQYRLVPYTNSHGTILIPDTGFLHLLATTNLQILK
jgi:hypothetical protein